MSGALATLRFGGIGAVQVSSDGFAFFAGVARHRLAIRTAFHATWLPSDQGADVPLGLLTASVTLTHAGHRHLAEAAPTIVELRGHPSSQDILVDLADDQLVAIEQVRAGGDVALLLGMRLTLLNRADHPYATDATQVPLSITSGRWIEMLDQAGTEVAVVVRVPSPLVHTGRPTGGDDDASLTRAAERLRQARDELRDAQFSNCVATCRKALENLARIVPLSEERAVRSVEPARRTQEQRWASLFWDTKSLTNAASHDDDTTAHFYWSRADAEAVLATTAALIRRLTA